MALGSIFSQASAKMAILQQQEKIPSDFAAGRCLHSIYTEASSVLLSYLKWLLCAESVATCERTKDHETHHHMRSLLHVAHHSIDTSNFPGQMRFYIYHSCFACINVHKYGCITW
jgi:hypothetical protein